MIPLQLNTMPVYASMLITFAITFSVTAVLFLVATYLIGAFLRRRAKRRLRSPQVREVSDKIILVVDDDRNLAYLLSFRLEQLGFSTMTSATAINSLLKTRELGPERIDLIIMDVNMPGGNGLAACEMLATDSRYARIPVIIYTGNSDPRTEKRCGELGAHYVNKGPDSWDRIKLLVCELLDIPSRTPPSPVSANDAKLVGAMDRIETPTTVPAPESLVAPPVATEEARHADPEGERPKVLCIDDDPAILRAMAIRLQRYGVEVLLAESGEQGFQIAMDRRPDVIITDLVLPEAEGCYIVNRMQSHPLTRDIPVMVLTGYSYPSIRENAVAQNVVAWLTKPLAFDRLLEELRLYLDLPLAPFPANSSNGPLTPAPVLQTQSSDRNNVYCMKDTV